MPDLLQLTLRLLVDVSLTHNVGPRTEGLDVNSMLEKEGNKPRASFRFPPW